MAQKPPGNSPEGFQPQINLIGNLVSLPAPAEQTQRAEAGDYACEQRQGSRKGSSADERAGVGERPINSVSRPANLVGVQDCESRLVNAAGPQKSARQHQCKRIGCQSVGYKRGQCLSERANSGRPGFDQVAGQCTGST